MPVYPGNYHGGLGAGKDNSAFGSFIWISTISNVLFLLNLFNLATKSHNDGKLVVSRPDLLGEQAQRIEGSPERWKREN